MDAERKIDRYTGSDWTDIAYRLGFEDGPGVLDEDYYAFIEARLETAEDAIRGHLAAMLANHSDTALGYERGVWEALLDIPEGEPAFLRMVWPLIKYAWV